MTNTNETIADIIAEIREIADNPECVAPTGLRFTANRLEAAWKREKNKIEADALFVGGFIEASRKRKPTAENSSAVGDAAAKREAVTSSHGLGDAAKMREALKTAKRYLDGYTVNILELRRKVDAALAAPLRNCDVGTADDQFEMWQAFCNQYDKDCTGCPCRSPHTTAYCFAKWGQMPYEEGGDS